MATKSMTETPDGPAAAAILSSAIGSLAIGLMTTGAEISAGLKAALNVYDPVGPLGGKTLVGVIAWAISWGVLHNMWKNQDVGFARRFRLSLWLLAIGFVLTFPPFFELFAAE